MFMSFLFLLIGDALGDDTQSIDWAQMEKDALEGQCPHQSYLGAHVQCLQVCEPAGLLHWFDDALYSFAGDAMNGSEETSSQQLFVSR